MSKYFSFLRKKRNSSIHDDDVDSLSTKMKRKDAHKRASSPSPYAQSPSTSKRNDDNRFSVHSIDSFEDLKPLSSESDAFHSDNDSSLDNVSFGDISIECVNKHANKGDQNDAKVTSDVKHLSEGDQLHEIKENGDDNEVVNKCEARNIIAINVVEEEEEVFDEDDDIDDFMDEALHDLEDDETSPANVEVGVKENGGESTPVNDEIISKDKPICKQIDKDDDRQSKSDDESNTYDVKESKSKENYDQFIGDVEKNTDRPNVEEIEPKYNDDQFKSDVENTDNVEEIKPKDNNDQFKSDAENTDNAEETEPKGNVDQFESDAQSKTDHVVEEVKSENSNVESDTSNPSNVNEETTCSDSSDNEKRNECGVQQDSHSHTTSVTSENEGPLAAIEPINSDILDSKDLSHKKETADSLNSDCINTQDSELGLDENVERTDNSQERLNTREDDFEQTSNKPDMSEIPCNTNNVLEDSGNVENIPNSKELNVCVAVTKENHSMQNENAELPKGEQTELNKSDESSVNKNSHILSDANCDTKEAIPDKVLNETIKQPSYDAIEKPNKQSDINIGQNLEDSETEAKTEEKCDVVEVMSIEESISTNDLNEEPSNNAKIDEPLKINSDSADITAFEDEETKMEMSSIHKELDIQDNSESEIVKLPESSDVSSPHAPTDVSVAKLKDEFDLKESTDGRNNEFNKDLEDKDVSVIEGEDCTKNQQFEDYSKSDDLVTCTSDLDENFDSAKEDFSSDEENESISKVECQAQIVTNKESRTSDENQKQETADASDNMTVSDNPIDFSDSPIEITDEKSSEDEVSREANIKYAKAHEVIEDQEISNGNVHDSGKDNETIDGSGECAEGNIDSTEPNVLSEVALEDKDVCSGAKLKTTEQNATLEDSSDKCEGNVESSEQNVIADGALENRSDASSDGNIDLTISNAISNTTLTEKPDNCPEENFDSAEQNLLHDVDLQNRLSADKVASDINSCSIVEDKANEEIQNCINTCDLTDSDLITNPCSDPVNSSLDLSSQVSNQDSVSEVPGNQDICETPVTSENVDATCDNVVGELDDQKSSVPQENTIINNKLPSSPVSEDSGGGICENSTYSSSSKDQCDESIVDNGEICKEIHPSSSSPNSCDSSEFVSIKQRKESENLLRRADSEVSDGDRAELVTKRTHATSDEHFFSAVNSDHIEAEARLAARRAARAEARELRLRELEKQQHEQDATEEEEQYATSHAVVPQEPQSRAPSTPRSRSSIPTNNVSRRSSEDSTPDEGLPLSARELKAEFRELDEKFRKAMITNASLDNEKSTLTFEVEYLKDKYSELEESHLQLTKDHRKKCSENEQLRKLSNKLKDEVKMIRRVLQERDELIQEYGLVLIGDENGEADSFDDLDDPERLSDSINALSPRRVAVKKALLSHEASDLLSHGPAHGSLDVRLRKYAEDKNDLEDEVRRLKMELEEELSRRRKENGLDFEKQKEASKSLNEYKFRVQKAEAEVSTLQANVARLESLVSRYKISTEELERSEEDLKSEKRRLQRELRDAQNRLEELELTTSHLQKRFDKLKTARSTLLKDLSQDPA